MKQQLLVENLDPASSNIIQESQNNGQTLYLNGVFSQADVKNRNNRIYPLSELSKAVSNMQRMIEENNGCFGCLDHHNSLSPPPEKISHVIEKVYMEGSNCMGRMRLLPTPMGIIAKTLIESNTKVGVSTVSVGSVNDDGIVSELQMHSCDIVVQPSCQIAYPNSLYESLDDSIKGRHVLSLAESVQHDQNAQKYLIKELKSFFESLK